MVRSGRVGERLMAEAGIVLGVLVELKVVRGMSLPRDCGDGVRGETM